VQSSSSCLACSLAHELEGMMRKDLREMIKDEVPYEKLLSHINATDTKLDEAISILNNTK